MQKRSRLGDPGRSFYGSSEPHGLDEYGDLVEMILADPDRIKRFKFVANVQGRNAFPVMLDVAEDMGLTPAEVAALILDAWSTPDWPEVHLGARRWVDLFKRAGYVTDSNLRQQDLTVYRGSTPDRWRGMAWTTSLSRARWFARRTASFGLHGAVYETHVPARHVLGRTNERKEAEVILNPFALFRRNVITRETTPPVRR